MIRLMTEFNRDKTRDIDCLKIQPAIERTCFERGEHSFGGSPCLTLEQIRQDAKEARQVHKVTAW